jgi:Spy/CpxP family protein refolding chaperone
MEHGSRTRLVTALVLAAVFGAGVLLGLAADSNLGAQPTDAVAVSTEEAGDDEETRRRSYTFEEVEPSESQLALIDSIVAEHRVRTNALDERLKAEYRSGFRSIVVESREAIKRVLTPEQAAEYQRLLDERDARDDAERQNEDEKD